MNGIVMDKRVVLAFRLIGEIDSNAPIPRHEYSRRHTRTHHQPPRSRYAHASSSIIRTARSRVRLRVEDFA